MVWRLRSRSTTHQTTRSRVRFVRLLVCAAAVVGAYAAFALVQAWFPVYFPRSRLRRINVAVLIAVESVYQVLVIVLPLLLATATIVVIRARKRRQPCPWGARVLALASALLVGSVVVELSAAAWLRSTRVTIPRLPTQFADPPSDREIDLLVIGESSAAGVPYSHWLSVGHIVGWKLEEALHGRPVRLDIQAKAGHTLAHMQDELAHTWRRPDLAIIYAGHNEFQAIYNWSHGAYHYADETPSIRLTFQERFRRCSPLCRMIQINVDRLRMSVPPPRIVTRKLVDVPVCTPAEYAERLYNFRTRLEVTVAYLERLGAVIVMIIPPANDATFEPNRSILPASTPRAEREAFADAFRNARAAEAESVDQTIAAFQALIAREPGFAESHFRLARLLERKGDREAAYTHYAKARDLDGFPMRCTSDFQNVYRQVAARHLGVMLIDGLEELRSRSPTGLLDDQFFNDGFHPSLNGHAVLAEAVLGRLHERRAFGWPADAARPVVTPTAVADHFGMDRSRWCEVCRYAVWFYVNTAYIRHDPTERVARATRYREAAPRILAGESFEAIAMPGLGPQPAGPANAATKENRVRSHAGGL